MRTSKHSSAVALSVGRGTVYRDRGDDWTLLYDGMMTIPFKDMVWYQDRVWCTSDYGLWTITNGNLQEAPVEAGVKICFGYLSARDGVLLVAGHGGAAFCEDGEWKVIFHEWAMSAAARKTQP